MNITKPCLECGGDFVSRSQDHRKFCSNKCRNRYGKLGASRHVPEPPPVDGARWIPIGHGKFALVDADDYPAVSQYTWFWMTKTYAGRRQDAKSLVFLHRFLLGEPDGEVDHRNMNKLDCRRHNLRVATRSNNAVNKKTHSACGFRGVSPADSTIRPWKAMVTKDNFRYNLGCFATKEEAALAYDAAARTLHGEYARLNFPNDDEQSTFADRRSPRPDGVSEPQIALRRQDGLRRPPSGFYGVYATTSKRSPWMALLWVDGKLRRIGSYGSREEAAKAYDAAASKAKGSKAKLNFQKSVDEAEDLCTQ